MELQLRDAETLNFTLYGHNNDNVLSLRPPGEEEEIKKTDDEGLRKAFYCCFPGPSTSESANQSRCLLWLSNQTVLNATTNKEPPLKRTPKGWCQDERAAPCVVSAALLKLERR